MEYKKKDFGFNDELTFTLDFIRDTILKNKFDAWIPICGSVGSGKSTYASQIAYYLSPKTHSLKYCCFSGEQLIEAINTAPKGTTILYDEAITSLDSTSSMSTMAKNLKRVSVQCRSKRLIVLMLLPNINLLNKFFVSRSCFLFHVYHKGYVKRGYIRAYGKEKMSKLYYYANFVYKYAPEMAFKKVYPDWRANFKNVLTYNEEEYEAKKARGLEDGKKTNGADERRKDALYKFTKLLKEHGHTQQNLADKLNISRTQFKYLIGTVKK